MNRVRSRIIEGGAIEDEGGLTAERYGQILRRRLAGEYGRFVTDFLSAAQPSPGARVLEVGPGPGWIGILLARACPDVAIEGLEASTDMIRAAELNAKQAGLDSRIRYLHGTVEAMNGVTAGAYDAVYSRDSLHHWEDPRRGFSRIAQVLKPGGTLFVRDSRRDQGLPARLIVNLLGPLLAGPMAKYWKSSIAASYTPVELEVILAEAFAAGAAAGDSPMTWEVRQDLMDVTVTARKEPRRSR